MITLVNLNGTIISIDGSILNNKHLKRYITFEVLNKRIIMKIHDHSFVVADNDSYDDLLRFGGVAVTKMSINELMGLMSL